MVELSGPNPFHIDGRLAMGTDFIGREDELATLVSRLDEAQSSAAIIGLPKIGKSSLARLVTEVLRGRGRIVHTIDAGAIPDGDGLFVALTDVVLESTLDTAQTESTTDSHRALGRLLKARKRNNQAPIFITLESVDEIQSWPDGESALRQLRVVVSDPATYGLIALFVSRQTIESIEIQLLGVSSLNGVVHSIHLREFNSSEVAKVCAKSLSATAAADSIFSESGGMPYSAQILAHRAHSPDSSGVVDGLWQKQTERIRRFLDCANLMEAFTLCVAQPESVSMNTASLTLKEYGLLVNEVVPEWARKYTANSDAVTRVLNQAEGQTVEFKASARWNERDQQRDASIEHAIVKTVCAFLNSDGGTLAIGVNDTGHPVGLDSDFSQVKPRDRDGLGLFLGELLATKIESNSSQFIDVSFHLYAGRDVCLVSVERSTRPTFAPGKPLSKDKWEKACGVFYIRNGNATNALSGVAMVDYLQSHWPREPSTRF